MEFNFKCNEVVFCICLIKLEVVESCVVMLDLEI